MIPVVNEKYKYLFLYSAKVGCTSLRQLYLSVHNDELTPEQLSQLDLYHNINKIHPMLEGKDYADYYTFIITRNPYARIVSAFLDQYVYAQNDSVKKMLAEQAGGAKPNNFIEFLQVLKSIPDGKRDSHFQTQSLCPHDWQMVTKQNKRYRWLRIKPKNGLAVDYVGDISGFNKHMKAIYQHIFKRDKSKLNFALEQLAEIEKKNSLFYTDEDFKDAAQLSVSQLDNMVFAPKPQDFYNSETVISLVNQIYHLDFINFGYEKNKIPKKAASEESAMLPDDFDWRTYLLLNTDLPREQIYNQRGVVRHYLEFGRFDMPPRSYKVEAPEGFDWQRYLSLHADLPASGITTEREALVHYLSFGIHEGREF